jgi:hypothetical protein
MEQAAAMPWLQEHTRLEEQVRQAVVELRDVAAREGSGNSLAERLAFAAAFCRLGAHARNFPKETAEVG